MSLNDPTSERQQAQAPVPDTAASGVFGAELERARRGLDRLASRVDAAASGGGDPAELLDAAQELIRDLRREQERLEAAHREVETERARLADLGGSRREKGTRTARQLLEERSARARAEAAGRSEAFLAEAGEILAASLDYEVTLGSVARLAVPRISDACIVYLVEEDGGVQRLAMAHADPEQEAALRAVLEQRPFDPDSPAEPVARALRTGDPELLSDIPAQGADPTVAPEGATQAAPDVPPPRSLMIVPLRVRERVLGALSFGWNEPGRDTPEALWLARRLADRAALAIDNARLHRQAWRASEAKSDFVAAMSHEFRTPLTAILAFADMMVAGIPEPISGVPLRHAERIVAAAKHLGELIDQVLTLSRIEAGRERVQREPVDVAVLARETAALVEPLARQKSLPLRVEAPDAGPTLQTDPNKVRQVLFNLLGNAVKFTDQGEIRLRVQGEGDWAVLEVHDTGEGIPPEHLERIWEPFWRAGHVNGERPQGSGLGLGIVRRLVHVLGGEIRARSEPGRGSVFTVVLRSDHLPS